MDNTVISGNSSGGIGGAGIYLPMEGSMVTGNNFARNTSNAWCGGLNIETSQAHTGAWGVIVENNYFIGNHAREGGAFTVFNIPVCLQNNVFSGNSAELRAGAILAWKDFPVPVPYMIRLINNSFYGNSAAYGGALYSVRSKPLIVNSIFYGDIAQTGQEIYAPYGKDTIEIAFTNIDFNEIIGHYKDGSGNFTRDPFYEDFELLTIGTDSPCLNSGTEAYTCSCGNVQCCPAYDIDGIPRPENGGVDVGAHELLFAGVPAPSLNESAQWCRVYPNPAADQVSFAYEITENGHCLLEVYDASGKLVATLLNSDQSQGRHLLQWNTEALNTGIYFYRLSGKGQHVVTSGKFIRL
jgi:hypothetical protein